MEDNLIEESLSKQLEKIIISKKDIKHEILKFEKIKKDNLLKEGYVQGIIDTLNWILKEHKQNQSLYNKTIKLYE